MRHKLSITTLRGDGGNKGGTSEMFEEWCGGGGCGGCVGEGEGERRGRKLEGQEQASRNFCNC